MVLSEHIDWSHSFTLSTKPRFKYWSLSWRYSDIPTWKILFMCRREQMHCKNEQHNAETTIISMIYL